MYGKQRDVNLTQTGSLQLCTLLHWHCWGHVTGLGTTGLLESEVAPKEILVKLQAGSVKMEYLTVFCISEGLFYHKRTTNYQHSNKRWIIGIKGRNAVCHICPTHPFICSCLPHLQNLKWKGRGDEKFSLEVWGVSHTQLSRSFLNFSWKTPPPSHRIPVSTQRSVLTSHFRS